MACLSAVRRFYEISRTTASLSPAADTVAVPADQMILLFMCPHNPGCCDEWDSDLGGNKAIVVPLEKLGHLTMQKILVIYLVGSGYKH